ncbi:MAG: hypothetical protein GTN49_09710 [candidate division Zixibacteria bacterium]|nr:hypothetical protein [candidate division Zixibacteria bacterium]
MNFRGRLKTPGAPADDVLVWELQVPAEAEGAVVAICDGYEYKLQLRSKMGGRKGSFAAWGAPAFRNEIEALLADLRRRYGVESAAPRPFSDADFAAGMHLAPRGNG